MSQGVNRATLKKGKLTINYFFEQTNRQTKVLTMNFYGFKNKEPIWK